MPAKQTPCTVCKGLQPLNGYDCPHCHGTGVEPKPVDTDRDVGIKTGIALDESLLLGVGAYLSETRLAMAAARNMTLDEKLDATLSICATYGTSMLGDPEQEQYLAGFKHSKTYTSARAVIEETIATSERAAQLQLAKRIKALMPDRSNIGNANGDKAIIARLGGRNAYRHDMREVIDGIIEKLEAGEITKQREG